MPRDLKWFEDFNGFFNDLDEEFKEYTRFREDHRRTVEYFKKNKGYGAKKKFPLYVQRVLQKSDDHFEKENKINLSNEFTKPLSVNVKQERKTEVVNKRITRNNQIAPLIENEESRESVILVPTNTAIIELDQSNDETENFISFDTKSENSTISEMPAPVNPPLRKNEKRIRNIKQEPKDDNAQPLLKPTRMSKRLQSKFESSIRSDVQSTNSNLPQTNFTLPCQTETVKLNEKRLKLKQEKTSSDQLNVKVTESFDNTFVVNNVNKIGVNETISIEKNNEINNYNDENDEMPNATINVNRTTTVVEKTAAPSSSKIPQILNSTSDDLESPVKKKVRAFEKLNLVKSNAQKKQKSYLASPSCTVKEKAKMFTPIKQKVLPKNNDSTTQNRTLLGSSSKRLGSANKLGSAAKPISLFREKEQKKQERDELKRQQEAQKQAQIEEKKLMLKQRFLKVQQQRQALEIERMEALEQQKKKEEKSQALLLKQQKLMDNIKEEKEKKRLLAKQKAEESKNQDLRKKILSKPKYLLKPTPKMPTTDCYDSDEEESNYKPVLPEWNKNVLHYHKLARYVKLEFIKKQFYSASPQFPDLNEIMDRNVNIKRTSSALWAHMSANASTLEEVN